MTKPTLPTAAPRLSLPGVKVTSLNRGKLIEAAKRAQTDVRLAAADAARLAADMNRLMQEAAEADSRGEADLANRLALVGSEISRRHVAARAKYDHAVNIAALFLSGVERLAEADALDASGRTAEAQKLRKGIAAIGDVIQRLPQVRVKLPPRPPEAKRAAAMAGWDEKALDGMNEENLGNIFKKAMKAVTSVRQAADKAGEYVKQNATTIGGVVGTVASAIPVVGPIVGPIAGTGLTMLQKQRKAVQADAPITDLDATNPGNQQMVPSHGPGTGMSPTTKTALMVGGGVAALGLLFALLRPAAPRVTPPV